MKGNYALEIIKAAHFTMAPKSVFDGQATIPRKAIELLILSRHGKIRKLSDVKGRISHGGGTYTDAAILDMPSKQHISGPHHFPTNHRAAGFGLGRTQEPGKLIQST